MSCDTFPMTHDTRESHPKPPPRTRGDFLRQCQVFSNHRGIAGASLKDAEVGSRKKSNFRRGGNPPTAGRRLADVTSRWADPMYFRVPRRSLSTGALGAKCCVLSCGKLILKSANGAAGLPTEHLHKHGSPAGM